MFDKHIRGFITAISDHVPSILDLTVLTLTNTATNNNNYNSSYNSGTVAGGAEMLVISGGGIQVKEVYL